MEAEVKYVVYEMNEVMGSQNHLALKEVEFNGWVSNYFDTEQQALDALVKDQKTYTNYFILKQVYLRL